MTERWYAPRDISFRSEHIYFLIEHLEQLEQGDYPDDPNSNYLDNAEDASQYSDRGIISMGKRASSSRSVNRLKLEICAGLAAEVTWRLEQCGKDGTILRLEVEKGTEQKYLSLDARHALWYCSGFKRKKMRYLDWLRKGRYMSRKRNFLTNNRGSASVGIV